MRAKHLATVRQLGRQPRNAAHIGHFLRQEKGAQRAFSSADVAFYYCAFRLRCRAGARPPQLGAAAMSARRASPTPAAAYNKAFKMLFRWVQHGKGMLPWRAAWESFTRRAAHGP